MFSHYFTSIDMLAVYPIASLVFFFIAFVCIVAWALKADDEYIRTMEELPLDGDAAPSQTTTIHPSTKGAFQ